MNKKRKKITKDKTIIFRVVPEKHKDFMKALKKHKLTVGDVLESEVDSVIKAYL